MKRHNGYTLELELEGGGSEHMIDALLVRRACDKWLASRGLLQEGGLNRRLTAEIRAAASAKEAAR